MTSFFRFGLSVFLVLLQLAAPLIHAHKNENNTSASLFHLPEFEQINENNSMMFVPAVQNDQVVTVSAGIKNNKRRFVAEDTFSFVIILWFFSIVTPPRLILTFFIKTEPITRYVFNLASPRAPPTSHFVTSI